jgi:mannose-1-phosphate guanylyltransferase
VVGRQAVILAGGQGTRLRPLTLARPKPVVPLLNHPFLAYQLSLLRQHDVTDVILSCSYRVEEVQAALGDGGAFGVRLRYVVEPEPLGTGGGVRNAATVASGTVFVLNGDVLTDVDLSAMRQFHESRGSRTTIFLTPVENPRVYGLVETTAEGRLTRFREKPGPDETLPTNMINAGVYLIDAELLPRIPADRPVSIEREFFPALIDDRVPSYGWWAPAYWRDIGSPPAYLAAQIDLLDGRLQTALSPSGARRDGSWVGDGVRVEPDAVIEAPCVVGAGVIVERGSHVGPFVVVGDGGRIGAGARLERAVLWERVEIGARASLAGAIVGADVTVGVGASIGEGVVLESGAIVPARTELGS